MGNRKRHKILTVLIAAVWLINGLLCKVLNLLPRHEQIVARILGNEYSSQLTILIGLAEVVMGLWILTGCRSKLNAVTQMTVIATMNIIEFFWASDLLLWGRMNAVFAILLIGLIYYHEFILNKKQNLQIRP